MSFVITLRLLTAISVVGLSTQAHAFFFIFPLPNLAKPAQLNSLIDALEKSEETKAVAYVSEDKTFGQKMWSWGHYSGHVPQAEADRLALAACRTSLANSKSQAAGGKALYDFGAKDCELHSFTNKTVSPRASEWRPPVTAPASLPPTPSPPAAQTSADTTPAPPTASQPAAASNAEVPRSPAAIDPRPPAPPQVSPVSGGSTPPDSGVARRLRELDALRKDGLISEAEYQEKRKAILSAL